MRSSSKALDAISPSAGDPAILHTTSSCSQTSGIQKKPLTQTTTQEYAEPLKSMAAEESVSQQHFRVKFSLLKMASMCSLAERENILHNTTPRQ